MEWVFLIICVYLCGKAMFGNRSGSLPTHHHDHLLFGGRKRYGSYKNCYRHGEVPRASRRGGRPIDPHEDIPHAGSKRGRHHS